MPRKMEFLSLLSLIPSVLAVPMQAEAHPPTHISSSDLLKAAAQLPVAPLFSTFRPTAMITTPYGWLNDPSTLIHLPNGDYHVYYEWSPLSTEAGGTNESWGHITSKNLIDWQPAAPGMYAVPNLALAPSVNGSDKAGIFTGTALTVPDPMKNCQTGANKIVTLYTGAWQYPIHWDISPYPYGRETLNWAESDDNGHTWTKHDQRPLLDGPPLELDFGYPHHTNKTARLSRATAFRDPSIFEWPKLADYLKSGSKWFGLICGGLHNDGPGCYLHSLPTKECDSPNYTRWKFIGLLPHVGINATFGDHNGVLGANFEMGSVLPSLKREYADGSPAPATGADKDLAYVILGTEGGASWLGSQSATRHTSATRWLAVNPSAPQTPAKGINTTTNNPTLLQTIASGPIDLGNLYALNQFYDEQKKMNVLIGWSNDDSFTASQRAAQGWAGVLSVPTELYEQVVKNARRSLFPGSITDTGLAVPTTHEGEYSTLAVRPVPEVWQGIQSRAKSNSSFSSIAMSGSKQLATKIGPTVLLHATFDLEKKLPFKIGLVIEHHNAGSLAPKHLLREPVGTKQTTISFDFETSYLTVDRSKSHFSLSLPESMTKGWNSTYLAAQSAEFDATPDGGPLMLYQYPSGWESLELKVVLDHSMLQVFANGRRSLTTRIYPATNEHSLAAFVDGSQARVSGQVWDKIPQLVYTS